jgi:hypothetical protein
MDFSRRTILRFHYVVLSEQRCGSPMDQGERASVEFPVAAGHLQDTISPPNLNGENNNERFILLISFKIW